MLFRSPFEAALGRADLARAYRAAGDGEAAERELEAAGRALLDLGAAPWASLIRERSSPPTTARERLSDACVFRREGDTRTITYDGTTVRLKDLKGMRYLERLLAEPGREFHALDLVSVERGALPTGSAFEADPVAQCGLQVFDSRAREAYRRRLAEVEEDLAEAEANNDVERAALARADREFLIDELRRGVGLNDRARTVGDGAERARSSATRSLRYALRRIGRYHADLAAHLDRTVRTGTYFAYEPDPRAPVAWET